MTTATKKPRRVRTVEGILINPKGLLADWYYPECEMCRKRFIRRTIYSRCCSYRCVNDDYIAKRAVRRDAARRKQCARCGKGFLARRRDAKYCGPACKQVAYRGRVTDAGCVDSPQPRGVTHRLHVTDVGCGKLPQPKPVTRKRIAETVVQPAAPAEAVA